jgi:hypothetical protein
MAITVGMKTSLLVLEPYFSNQELMILSPEAVLCLSRETDPDLLSLAATLLKPLIKPDQVLGLDKVMEIMKAARLIGSASKNQVVAARKETRGRPSTQTLNELKQQNSLLQQQVDYYKQGFERLMKDIREIFRVLDLCEN